MTVLVVLLGVVVALLAVLVVGLLRSHAEILRQLHELGAGVYAEDSGSRPAGATTNTTEPDIRTQPGVPTPRDTLTPAFDVSGVTPRGSNVAIGIVGRPHPTLLAFLTSGCTTCGGFWQAFADGEADELPGGDTRLVVVTRGAEAESPATVAGLAPGQITVVMSTEAWQDYKVPVSPYFVLVDGPGQRIIGEGAGTTWAQVASLLEQACADAGLTVRGRPRPPMNGPGHERRADEELLRAGIGPGHPSLYGDPEAAATPSAPAAPASGSPASPDPEPRQGSAP